MEHEFTEKPPTTKDAQGLREEYIPQSASNRCYWTRTCSKKVEAFRETRKEALPTAILMTYGNMDVAAGYRMHR